MRRRYTRESYLDLVGRIRAIVPEVALSTDMIVGFPGETDADFEETLSLTAAVRFHSMFSFKYSPRPNTLADRRLADDVHEGEKTRRIVALQALQRSIQLELNEALVGREVEVLVDGAQPPPGDGALGSHEPERGREPPGSGRVDWPGTWASASSGRALTVCGDAGRMS